MRASRTLLAIVALVLLAVGVSAKLPDVNSAAFQSALSEVERQVEAGLAETQQDRLGAAATLLSRVAPAPAVVPPPIPSQAQLPSGSPRFRSLTLQSLNALDLVTDRADPAAGDNTTKAANDGHTVAAFTAIAGETMLRARYAIGFLEAQHAHFAQHVAAERHNLNAWLENQRARGQWRITAETQRVTRLTDEIQRQEKIYQDAVAKEQSYQTEAQQLTTEWQLQRTPPLNPSVVAGALSDAQFKEAIAKLRTALDKARAVMQASRSAIEKLKLQISQATDWIKSAQATLQRWEAEQRVQISRRMEQNNRTLAEGEARVGAVRRIYQDAEARHKSYQDTAARLNLATRIKGLGEEIAHWSAVKPVDPYHDAKLKAFIAALSAEKVAFEKKLATLPGEDLSAPPPASWGVLAAFPLPATANPYSPVHIGNGIYAPQPTEIGRNPGLDFSVRAPGAAALEANGVPAAAAAPTTGAPAFVESAAVIAPRVAQAESSPLAPPVMPNLPPPPDVQLAQILL